MGKAVGVSVLNKDEAVGTEELCDIPTVNRLEVSTGNAEE